MRVLAITIALVGGALGLVSSVQAQGDDLDQEGRALFEAGRVAFDAGRYDDALEHFNDAYERSRRPSLLYNVGLAADRAGQVHVAIRAYSKFLDSVTDSPERPTIEARLVELRAQAAAEQEPQPEPPGGVPVITDNGSGPRDPVIAPVAPQPQPIAQPVVANTAQNQQRMADPPSRLPPVLTIVGGVVLAVAGAALIGAAFGAKSEAEGEIMWPRANEANEQARRFSGTGYALIGLGVIAAGAGVIWLLRSNSASYGLTLGPTQLGLRGQF